MRLRNVFILCFLSLFVISCSFTTDRTLKYDDTVNKDYVLTQVRARAKNSCEYKGRAVLRYEDGFDTNSFRSLVDKQCAGNVHIRLLGPFSMVVAEIFYDSVSGYRVMKGEQDITADTSSVMTLTAMDLEILSSYLKLPPPLPDSTFDMIMENGSYLFSGQGTVIVVNPDFYVSRVAKPDHAVQYSWEEGALKEMIFSRGAAILSVTFTDVWKTE